MNKLNHLADIMDGNRRWAKKRNLPTLKGHQRGYEKLKQVGDWCLENGIKFLTVYAFSNENWHRKKSEVNYLMKLMLNGLKNDIDEFHSKGIRLKAIGQIEKFPKYLQKLIHESEEITKNNKKAILILCLSYGGRTEIADAVKKIVAKKIKPAQITEKLIEDNLYFPEAPAPELIIRTGGEFRMSNFLAWQSVYSELFFSKTLWPALSHNEFNEILDEYGKRQRRFGK
jgi:undecaprenyl diphosphate synthase